MNIEPFIYLFLFLFFVLLTSVFRWLKGEVEKVPGLEDVSKPFGLYEESPAPFGHAKGSPRDSQPRTREEPSRAPAKTKRRLKKVKIHPGNLQEMRRGIVLMTVLGPCRSLQPPPESPHF